jgi:hypothetical protein
VGLIDVMKALLPRGLRCSGDPDRPGLGGHPRRTDRMTGGERVDRDLGDHIAEL